MKQIHFARLISEKVKKNATRPLFYYQDASFTKWLPMTWGEFSEKVMATACSLAKFGIKPSDTIGICSQNKPENMVVDFANYANRAISVPVFATASAPQIEYIVNDARVSILFVGEQLQFDNAIQVKSDSLKLIVAFDSQVNLRGYASAMYFDKFMQLDAEESLKKEVEKRQKEAVDEDLAVIMYTSGTTGESKGVMLPHSCFAEAMRIHDIRLTSISKKDRDLMFLPISHIFERAWAYFLMMKDVPIYINLQPTRIQQTLREVRPSLMANVPRFWEKVAVGVKERIDTFSPFKKALVAWGFAVGKTVNLDYRRNGKHAPFFMYMKYKFADKFIFSKLKKTVGIENGNMFPAAGASMHNDLIVFFRSLGIPIVYGYGLTETTATVCAFDYKGYKIGTMGKIMPGIQVKIGEDDEILVKGKTVMHGYYNKPEATAAAFVDGWFKTGDVGKIVDGDNLAMTDRLKDLFKTSNGKYIAPQQIETKLGMDPYIEQIAVIGNNKNFVTAIIAPNMDAVKKYAAEHHISYQSNDELLQNREIIALFEKRIEEGQLGMANYEKIKKFRLIKKGFTIEAGELTSTLKLRRAIIQQNYKYLIDEMYESSLHSLI